MAAATSVLYKRPKLHSLQAFELLEKQITQQPKLGHLVRELDLSNLILTRDDKCLRGVTPKLLLSLLDQIPLVHKSKAGVNGVARD